MGMGWARGVFEWLARWGWGEDWENGVGGEDGWRWQGLLGFYLAPSIPYRLDFKAV